MAERLTINSFMTADGKVIPLGPADKEGNRVPLDTRELYGEDGKCFTVRCFLYFPFTNGVQVYCPDNGGSLRLRYDLGMRGAGSLREDSTLCLLWAMLMDSYSRWRTTGGLFIEASD